MIGIIGAMPLEIENILKIMSNLKCESFSHIKFFLGKIKNFNCILAICGPGKVNAAICSQIMILKYNPKIIINIGVAGALKNNIKIGDFVLADYVVQYDMNTSAVGDPKGFISGINLIKIPCSNSINKKIKLITSELNEKIHIGTIATGDEFVSNKEKLLSIKNTFNAIACEMESGSIGHVCFINKIKFAAIRVISDNADENSNKNYEKFKIISAQKTTQIIEHLVDKF